MPYISGFILGAEQQAHNHAAQDGGGDAAGSGFQTAGENAKKAVLVYCLPDALGQQIAKAGQGYCGSGSGKLRKGAVQSCAA